LRARARNFFSREIPLGGNNVNPTRELDVVAVIGEAQDAYRTAGKRRQRK
jgi:hypothetical protein